MRAAGLAVVGNIVRCAALGSLGWFLISMGEARAEGLAAGRTFYVDSAAGRDDNDGLAADRAWRSLERVNSAALEPGDTVRFRRGRQWRGSLVPVSGDGSGPITYTAFGEGEKPLLLGSLPRSRPQDWVQVTEKVWATLPTEYQPGRSIADLKTGAWSRHQEAGARVTLTTAPDAGGAIIRLVCAQSGTAGNHIQLWGPTVPVEKGATLLFTFRARSARPFQLSGISINEGRAPWKKVAASGGQCTLGPDWSVCKVPLQGLHTSQAGKLHMSLGNLLPADATLEFQPQGLCLATPSVTDPLSVDVGNVIFDDGAVCGWKKWSPDDLKKPYDYFYERSSQRVYLHCDAQPASKHRSIELAMARHVVNQGGAHHVVYDGLAIKYGAAHGFGGGGTHNVVIRNCDVGYIGGAHQFTSPDGKPVRFGNGIEFWGAARDNLVEGCRLWQVYDAALTNQGKGPGSNQINITYRNNLIRNAEYSFEYWNNPEAAVTKNIRFINNTCVDAGVVWSHEQRPDRNGSHIMFYANTADTSGVEVKYNIFCGATDWGSRYSSGWKVLPETDYNLWYSTTGVACWWFRQKIASFDEYRQTTKLDAHSKFADPGFVDAAKGDYRLKPDSPARKLRPDSAPVGAEMFWQQ